MNENDQASQPSTATPNPEILQTSTLTPTPPPLPCSAPKPKPLSWWLRKFFACNPFYLVSAALLLYGCYRISIDETFVNRETARLLFSFSSVQVYELVVVGVAIFLARRCLWYDSTLLAGLENMLVFVPFILISQAALTGPQLTGAVCAAGVLLVLLRFGSLKKYFTQLNLPVRLLAMGAMLLALNVALPLTYRHYVNFKLGTHLDAGPDYVMNECMWLLALPVALALVNLLSRAQTGGDLLPQRRWLPEGLFALWFIVTGVHLYCLDYIYGYYLRPELFAPMAWVLAWTVFVRVPKEWPTVKYALMFPALAVPFLAIAPGAEKTYLPLAAANIAAYGVLRWFYRGDRFAGHLAYASALMLVAGLPTPWLQFLGAGTTGAGCVGAGIALYVLFWTAWLPNPKLAVLGSMLFGAAIATVFWNHTNAMNWAFQGGLIFFLLHSLRWNDAAHAGADGVRTLTGIVWVIQSLVWMHCENSRFWMPFIPGVMVLGVYCICLPWRGIWRLYAVPAAALLVILSGPCSMAIDRLRSTPVGLLAVVASFLFLGAGTVAALTREFWHKHEQETKPE